MSESLSVLKILGKRLRQYRKDSESDSSEYMKGRMDELIQLIQDVITIEDDIEIIDTKDIKPSYFPAMERMNESLFKEQYTQAPQLDSQTRYIPVTKWNEYHEWPTLAAFRSLIFNKDENGLFMAIKKVGKRILIDETAFFEWMKKR